MGQGLLMTAMMVLPAMLAAMPAEAASITFGMTFGAAQDDEGYQVVTDSAGFLYVLGTTRSAEFHVVKALQPIFGGAGPLLGSTQGDVVVMKLDPTGATVWATYLGGSSGEGATGIAVDAAGDVYVAGHTSSTNFPTTAGVARPSYGGGESDAFVARIRADGSALVYATYLGGRGREIGAGMAVDREGNAYVGGDTSSSDFPVANGVDMTHNGGLDAYVAKLNADGSAILGATFLGGGNNDEADYVGLDAEGNILAAGYTLSSDFPTKEAYDGTFNGGAILGDAWVARLAPDVSSLAFSTFLGGSGGDGASQVVEDARGDLHVVGHTASTDFPLVRPVQAAFAGGSGWDGYLATLSADGSALRYGSYLGGTGSENVWGVAIDEVLQRTYVTGWTPSADFPLANALQSGNAGATDIFVALIDEAAGAMRFSTLLGGSGDEGLFRPQATPTGELLLAASTNSPDFPIPDYANAGGNDIALLRLAVPLPSTEGTVIGPAGENGWWLDAITFDIRCPWDSSTTITYSLDDDPVQRYTEGVRVEGDGLHNLWARCEDEHGNGGESSHLIPIDGTPPRTHASVDGSIGGQGWYRSDVHVGLGCSDLTSGCAATLASQVDDATPCCAFTLDGVAVTVDGVHTLRFQSRDIAGNLEAAQLLEVRKDATAPSTTAEPVGIVGNAGWYRSAVTLGMACSDATSGCAASVAEDIANAEPVGAEPVNTQGITNLRFRSTDVAGNIEADQLLELRIDSVAPRTTAEPVNPANARGWHNTAVTVDLACADGTSGCAATSARVDGAAGANGLASVATVAGDTLLVEQEGILSVAYASEDVAGNTEAEGALPLRIDMTPPDVAVVDPAPGVLYIDGVAIRVAELGCALGPEVCAARQGPPPPVLVGVNKVRAEASDALSGVARVELWFDGALRAVDEAAPFEFDLDVGGEVLGEHALELRAVDEADNVDSDAVTVTTLPTTLEGLLATAALLASPAPVDVAGTQGPLATPSSAPAAVA